MKLHIIHHEKFQQLQALERAADNHWQRRKIKNALLDRIAEALGRKYRLSKKAVLVIEEIVWKASDFGFSFNGRQTLADKLDVSLRTVDNAIRLLKDSGQVIVAYRENKRSNGVRTPVIIFKNHPNFQHIVSICDIVCKVENGQESRETTDSSPKSIPTYSLPLKHEKHNKYPHIMKYVSLKVQEAHKKNPAGIMHLGAYVDKVIRNEQRKALHSAKKRHPKPEYQPIGISVFNWLEN